MTFVDPGQFYDQPQNLPPPAYPTRPATEQDVGGIRVRPKTGPVGTPEGVPGGDPYAAAGFSLAPPKAPSAKAEAAPPAPAAADPYAAAGFAEHPPEKPAAASRQIGTEEAAVKGLAHGMTFGAAPALAGAAEASGTPTKKIATETPFYPQGTDLGHSPDDLFAGAAKLIHENLIQPLLGQNAGGLTGQITGDQTGEATKAYHRGRQAALEDERLAQEQHPHAFLAGQIAGSLATPGFGAARAGTALERIGRGIVAGGTGGALQGGGTALSENLPVGEAAKRVATTAAIGAPLGGALTGALGRAAVNPAAPGVRAAATARDLGAPIPRGLASDNAAINASASAAKSIPWFGAKMSSAVDRTQEAAGNRIEAIAGHMAGPATDRAAADVVARGGLQGVIDANRAAIDAAYSGVRGRIDQAQHFTMPRTDAALNAIMAARQAAGHPNPAAGLEQFRNVAGGATFNGAHRARVDAREAGNALVPHPGYNAGDFNRLTRAMTADLREMVQAAARGNPGTALRAFDAAEREFGRLADQNKLLHGLVNAKGEAAIATLLRAGKEKGGNLRLLAQLRNSMPAHEFEVIGGTLLNELGHNNATGHFSLSQFVTGWDKLSDRAKGVLFSPQHLGHIEDIVNLGSKIKSALRTQNTSHTSNTIILFDLARDAVMLGVGLGTGAVTAGAAATGGAVALPAIIFARWLSSPPKAAAMSTWSRAYWGMTAGQPTPARIAAFNAATRNLASNLNVPVENIVRATQARLLGRAQENSDSEPKGPTEQKR